MNFDDIRVTAVLAVLLMAGITVSAWLHEAPAEPHPILEETRAVLARDADIVITARELYDELADGDHSDDPFILSIRDQDHYEYGHIPGAVRMDWEWAFTDENLSKLPGDRQIVVYCYYNHQAAQMAALLQLAGFDAVSLEWGMCAWTRDPGQKLHCFNRSLFTNEYPLTGGAAPGEFPRDGGRRGSGCGADEVYPDPPGVEDGERLSTTEIITEYLRVPRFLTMDADPLYYRLRDPFPENDPYVLDIRDADLYTAGHIPGAVRFDLKDILSQKCRDGLPGNESTIVVVSETEHRAGYASALLNVNGYEAVALEWGMVSWTTDEVVAPGAYNNTQNGNDFPVVSGAGPGALGM
jgi:rhodanese-related sulfurtransferase